MKARGFPNLAKPLSAATREARRLEREALALYEAQLVRMCWRKTGYLSESDANRKIKYILTRRPATQLRTYKCPACIFWHLTSTRSA